MSSTILAVIAGLMLGLFYLLRIGRREAGLPPGPPTKPILGNLTEMPTSNIHMQLTEWSKQYGGIYSLKLAHATAIVLTDRRLIRELVDKRGTIYNSRQNVFIINRYVARDPANIPLVIFLPSGDKLRLCRKLLNQYFNEARVEQEYVPIIEAESNQMVFDLWKKPEDLMMHPVRLANSLIMTLVYARRTNDADQLRSYLEEFEKYARLLEPGAIPPVDLLPWLEYVPQSFWLGCWKNWKSKGDEAGRRVYNNFSTQAKSIIERRERGINAGSFYDFLLDQEDKIDLLTRRDLNIFAGSMIDAGSDTTASSVGVFIQAMCKYPDVQARAHKHVDEVIGNGRSPRWSDFSTLPYVVQIIKEVLRWRPIAGSIPHSTTADDTVNGYFIPKDSLVLINIWGINHNPIEIDTSGSPPSEFNPDRYANRTQLSHHYAASPDFASRDHYTYGAGRRICPGIHLAERTLFIAIAKLLWAFEFREKPDKPVDVDPQTGYTSGIVKSPKPFECRVLVRHGREGVIEREFGDARSVLGKFEE